MNLKPLALALAFLTPALAQQPNPSPDAIGPAFEVATIRPSSGDPGAGGWMGFRLAPSGRLSVRSMPLDSLVGFAYADKPGPTRVDGGPSWAKSQHYDIEAKVDDAQMADWDKLSDADRTARVRPMLRALLADRFQLKLHTEMRDTPVYALVQAKGGAKLKEVTAPAPLEGDGDEMQKMMRQMADHPGQPLPGGIMCTGRTCTGHAVKMSSAAGQIGASSSADRIVLDETGLTGFYDFSYTISRDADAATPMQQIEDQLGLRFESRKIPIKTYIIDSAQQPSQN